MQGETNFYDYLDIEAGHSLEAGNFADVSKFKGKKFGGCRQIWLIKSKKWKK